MTNANTKIILVRPVDFVRDMGPLSTFLVTKDVELVATMKSAVEAGDTAILVAEVGDKLAGIAMAHIRYRDDYGFVQDGETAGYIDGENAYLSLIDIHTPARRRGIGTALLHALEAHVRPCGKRRMWLHTDESNVVAHRFYEHNGWTHTVTVYPEWKKRRATRVYSKEFCP